jgi:hypothetical protein
MIPIGLFLLCFCYYLAFLLHMGEMFYKGADVVANAAYGMTLFTEVHRAGWTVPKPTHMLFFGATYWITRDLWFLHLVLVTATALTVWAGCRLIRKHDDSLIGCLAFCLFMMVIPRTFGATLMGGPGCLNVAFLLLALFCVEGIDRKWKRALAVLFLSLANLTRPDSWPCTYAIIFLIVAMRFAGGLRPGWRRGDLLFLIPLGMPLVWVVLDWTIFGDPLYSMKIARAFVLEAVLGRPLGEGPGRNELAAYFPRLKDALVDLFSLSGWFSLRTGLVGILCLTGMARMFRTDRRNLLFVACLLGGTLLFYFVYAVRGTLFRTDYIYAVFVGVLLIVSVGLGSLSARARRARPGWLGRFVQGGFACAVLLALTVAPFQKKVLGERIPILKKRAIVSERADAAIEALAEDMEGAADSPIILTTQWVPGSRIAIRLRTGRDIALVERLVSRQRLGKPSGLPDFRGRTVYCCFLNRAQRDVTLYLNKVIRQARRTEIVHDEDGLVVVKCSY